MTHGKPCVKVHVFTRHMTCHVCDTWQAMCQLACNVKLSIYGKCSYMKEGGEGKEKRKGGKERKGKEKRKRDERKEKRRKGKEREKEEGGRQFLPQFIGVPTVETRWTKE